LEEHRLRELKGSGGTYPHKVQLVSNLDLSLCPILSGV